MAFRRALPGNRAVVLAIGIGLIALGLLSLIIPGVGWVLGPGLVAIGVILLVLHFVRVARQPRTQ